MDPMGGDDLMAEQTTETETLDETLLLEHLDFPHSMMCECVLSGCENVAAYLGRLKCCGHSSLYCEEHRARFLVRVGSEFFVSAVRRGVIVCRFCRVPWPTTDQIAFYPLRGTS